MMCVLPPKICLFFLVAYGLFKYKQLSVFQNISKIIPAIHQQTLTALQHQHQLQLHQLQLVLDARDHSLDAREQKLKQASRDSEQTATERELVF